MKLPAIAATAALMVGVVAALPAAHADWRDLLKKAEDTVKGATGDSGGSAATALSSTEVAKGLKQALDVGIQRAIEYLGREGGFLDDAAVRIPMPKPLQPVESTLRRFGQDELADDFVETMNRAAERAVPETLDIFRDSVQAMTLDDAREILNGPDDAATQYLRRSSGERIQQAIRPLVEEATDKAGVTSAYKRMAGQAGSMLSGYMDTGSLDLDQHVTAKAVDGLFLKLAEEEQRIRENPAARSTELLKKVFGGG
ncbi:MAG: DUF4197 domain-containing protein [Gammaproteobacteria bacterium]|nr:DUF4197 domain-containing protein [Gammaproteobacteria bacterium]